MAYVPSASCYAAAKAAAGDKLTEQEVLDAFQRISDYQDRLKADGQLTGRAERLRRFGAEEAERTRIAAAMQRRHAALNAIIRDKLDTQIKGMTQGGLKPRKALLAVLEGTQRAYAGGRVSVSTMRSAYEARYLGSMISEIFKDQPHITKILNDEKLDADVLREMMELREGGKPGVTGNTDAKYLASTFAKYAELSRTDLNKLGGSIGKLDGWAGVQMHDDIKMIAGPSAKDSWVGYILTKLDLEKTFPEGLSPDEATSALGDIYDTIITGLPNRKTAGELGQRVSPANMAKSLGASRVLHFKDAESTLAYRERYGYSNTIGGMIHHLRNAARVAANMEMLGPNPEVMFTGVADGLKRQIKEAAAVPAGVRYGPPGKRYTPTLEQWKAKETHDINTQAGVLRTGLDVATGAAARPVNVTAANIGSNIRAWQSMAKLGAALPSSLADVVTAGAAAQFRGTNFFRAVADQLSGIFGAHGGADAKEISYLLGEGFDGLLGHINAPAAGEDRLKGFTAKAMEKFFRFNGLTWWTDAGRAVAGRLVAAEMGMRSGTAHDALPGAYRHVLELNGIDAKRWDIIRSTALRSVNGRAYVTPDRIRDLPDDAFLPVVQDRIDAARKASKGNAADFAERSARILDDGRRDVELSMLRFVADETNYGVIKTDAPTQRLMASGGRAGTLGGEALRYVAQFKGFPLAFANRIGGRALFGQRADASVGERAAHIGSLLAGLTVAGYMAMTMKDILKGYWPPRNPADPRTIMAAFQQGGALGVYSDFLFGGSNRFGGTLLETLAGPTVGSISQLADVAFDARDAAISGGDDKFSKSRAFSTLLAQTPYANLHLLAPALNYLILNSIRESISPGYLRAQAKSRMTEYGQTKFIPDTMSR